MTIEEIKELLELFHSSGVGEMEVQRGENRLRLTRAAAQTVIQAAPAAIPTAPGAAAPVAAQPAAAQPASSEASEAALEHITSPIVGTFYDKPAPDDPPFVKPGDRVEPGQVVCIIESMKLMNKIESEIAGTVVARLVEDSSPVEYGQPLFSVRPD